MIVEVEMPRLTSTLVMPGEFKLSPSERQQARKMHEEIELGYFLAAYKWATGEGLDTCLFFVPKIR